MCEERDDTASDTDGTAARRPASSFRSVESLQVCECVCVCVRACVGQNQPIKLWR
ncbi:MAG: hypothetical protein P4L40_19425 [Terracidiphilus sp.]|nr:hypothetical protein [Terracidiphilus sp.]